MLNIFKVNKALRQAMKHVEEVNKVNDDLTKMGREQNDLIAKQQATIESLQKKNSKLFLIEFEDRRNLKHIHENVFTSKASAKQYLEDEGYQVGETDIAPYESEDNPELASILERNLIIPYEAEA